MIIHDWLNQNRNYNETKDTGEGLEFAALG